MRSLLLALKREYFEAIRDGSKTEEYRLVTPFWEKRLRSQTYDRIIFTWGYPRKGDPDKTIWRPWNGCYVKVITHPHFGPDPVEVFAIPVGSGEGIRP